MSGSGWLDSPFRPSSSILDATLSIYGNHDVAAINDHAAPKEAIDASTKEIRSHIESALASGLPHCFSFRCPGRRQDPCRSRHCHARQPRSGAVFVTGNAPLVEVLNEALGASYRAQGQRAAAWTPTGYRRADAKFVTSAASFKIIGAQLSRQTRSTASSGRWSRACLRRSAADV